jgi:hypothetical protein
MKLLKLLWGRSKKEREGGTWVVGKKKRKKKEKRSGTWVVGKKKKGGNIQRNRGRGRRKIGKKDILGVEEKKNNNNEYLNEIELRIENRM